MITIAYEPISKRYGASIFSRSFCLSNFCYIMVFLLPLLILINIDYSWPQYQRIMLQPSLEYRAYQLVCLNADDTVLYNSNFNGEIGTKNYNSFVSVSMTNNILQIEGSVYSNQLLACDIQFYLSAKLQTSMRSIVNFPLSFSSQNEGDYLSNAVINSRAYIVSKYPLPQSSILTINQSDYSQQNSFEFMKNWQYAGTRNITVDIQQNYHKLQNNPSPSNGMFKFTAKIKFNASEYLKETSLIDKLRGIGPIFIFLAVLLYYFIIDPLVDWMIDNKVYSGKTFHAKIKKQ